MTQPSEDLVRAASAAFGRGDFSTLMNQFFAEDVLWHIGGTGPLAGDYEGAAEVLGALGKISELSAGTIRPELHDVLASDGHLVVLVTIHAERAGKKLQLDLVHVIHAADGKATEIWTHSADPAAAAQFWSLARASR
jgi:uncharacterized protein